MGSCGWKTSDAGAVCHNIILKRQLEEL